MLRRLADGTAAALLAAIAGLAFFQVVARYALGLSTPWSEELLRLLFIWLVLIGAARASHMRIDLAERAAGARGRRAIVAAGAAVGAALLVLMIVHGLDLVDLTAYDRYTALPLSVQWAYWAVVAGCGLWLVFLAIDSAEKWRSG